MELTIRQRLVLLQLLPQEGSLLTIKLVRELREALSFTDEELESFGVKQDRKGGRVVWDGEPHPVEVPIGKTMQSMIRAQIAKVDKVNKMTLDTLELAELFEYGGGDAEADDADA